MADNTVYTPTTAPNPKSSWFAVPSENMDKIRFIVKIIEVLLSFVAFITEEVVNSCITCSSLYFFEFVSCTAFLFTLLLLILLSTTLHSRTGITCWPSLDFVYTGCIGLLFLIASIVFASDNGGTTMERTAVAFGFLASVMFFVDLVLLVKNNGFPFKSDGKAAPSNGGPVTTEAPPETEKLNTPAE
ncbi:CKLF-like MARVEL transmembrane domain-containing protein 6 [Plectropomus leopardus]|uniref:CKLF-like MARVEL transmembrane domain-containing protein 6 n=1 Tax=Plectropomus leopardus TaxID=160734 RepID=UPI001C4DACEB|nr:CKLF-like MARVEL transmembrane domain-containing protein 6 [Plectropomus leopardus]